jgi:hypothetical protein
MLTKNQLKQMYFFGLLLSKVISRTRMQSMVQQSQFINPEIQKEISTVIEKDATLTDKITQLQSSECDCEDEKTSSWAPIILCVIIYVIGTICGFLIEAYAGLLIASMYRPLFFLLFFVLGGWLIGGIIVKIAMYVGNLCWYLGIGLNCWPGGP